MGGNALKAAYLERRTRERRSAALATWQAGERRAAERRATDSAAVSAWLARFDQCRAALA